MRVCTNCGSQITCGCQDRVASNGAKVCSSCLVSYEQNLAAAKTVTPQITINAVVDNEKSSTSQG
jgi:NMD protein affecting ribosome stability and mRNA decay